MAQLEAVRDGRADEAAERTRELADAVLASPVVRAALAAKEGGPLAVARGVQLAELVLEAEAPAATSRKARGA